MGLFHFGAKKEEKTTPACACNGSCETYEAPAASQTDAANRADGLQSVKVLGSGCKSCHALYENAVEALKNRGDAVEAEYVTDMSQVAAYGVMSTPALVVNEKVVSMGKVMNAQEIEKLLQKIGY